MYSELNKKIKKRLDNYIEFDSNKLFTDNDCVIFGGAIRDSISDNDIHDIDILCGSESMKILHDILIDNDYKFIEKMSSIDIASLYTDIHIIHEPHTYMNNNLKVIQLIKPSLAFKRNDDMKDILKDVIKNVDISCCGVSYNIENGLQENYENAVKHCYYKIFCINKDSYMYNVNRVNHRRIKLENRGWKYFDKNSNMEKELIRNLSIKKILNNECI